MSALFILEPHCGHIPLLYWLLHARQMYLTPWFCPKNPPPPTPASEPIPPMRLSDLFRNTNGKIMNTASAIATPENGGHPRYDANSCIPMLNAKEPKRNMR